MPQTHLQKSKGCYIPARYGLLILIFFGTCVSYIFRTNMSLAIVAMVKKDMDYLNSTCSNCSNNSVVLDSTCSSRNLNTNGTTENELEGSYEWSSSTQGFILGSFFYGYACTQIIMGRLADKFGAKLIIGTGMLLGSVLTALVPIVAEWGVVCLIVLRVLTGMTQGVLYPGITVLFIRWIPPAERSTMYCLSGAGATIGIIICMPVVGWLCKLTLAGGWPLVFYIFGGAGFVWSILWILLSSNDPSNHPRISEEELDFIRKSIPEQGLDPKVQPKVPWKALLTSTPIWAYIFTFSCSSWVYYTQITELPSYLNQVLHSPIQENGFINAFIYSVSMVVSILGGLASDKILEKKLVTKTQIRKLMESTALIGSSASMIGVTLSGCNITAVIAFLTLSCGFLALANSGDCMLAMDIAPTFSGTVFGIANCLCSVTGFISPLVTGFVIDNTELNLVTKWKIVFYMSVGFGIAGVIVAASLWSADVQPWDPSYEEPNQDNLEPFETDNDKAGLIVDKQLKRF